MDSDDFYFPSYVDWMVKGLLSQSVLYLGLLGFHCTQVTKGKVRGYGFSWNARNKVQLVGTDDVSCPSHGFSLAFFTFIRAWLRWENFQTTEEIGLSWHLSRRDALHGWNHTSALGYCKGEHNSSAMIKYFRLVASGKYPPEDKLWERLYASSSFTFFNQTALYPLPMWQQRAGICEQLFSERLWGYFIDREEGHVSKSIWRGALSYTHCGGSACNGKLTEHESGILQLLQQLDDFARIRGANATMKQFMTAHPAPGQQQTELQFCDNLPSS